VTLDEHLYDAATLTLELRGEVLPGRKRAIAAHRREVRFDALYAGRVVRSRVRCHVDEWRKIDDGVSFAAKPLGMFDNHAPGRWHLFPKLGDGSGDVRGAVDILDTFGVANAGFFETGPRAAFGAEVKERRVETVERDTELHGERSFESARGETGHVCPRGLDRSSDSFDEARSLQNLLGERTRGSVVRGQQRESTSRVCGGDALE
jgi:hypothetical protein